MEVSVIDWDDAMEQVGGDEEFLRELLVELNGEIESQTNSIENALRLEVMTQEHYIIVKRGAHVIKGSAANLMCPQLKQTSHELEKAAIEMVAREFLIGKYKELRAAIDNYRSMMASLGI